jgi:hypothetical protein
MHSRLDGAGATAFTRLARFAYLDCERSGLGPVEIQDSFESRILIQAPQRSFSWIAKA